MGLSKLSAKCQNCKYKNDCDNKRMVACAVAEMPELNKNTAKPITVPAGASVGKTITINMGEYSEQIADQLKKDISKRLYNCNFL